MNPNFIWCVRGLEKQKENMTEKMLSALSTSVFWGQMSSPVFPEWQWGWWKSRQPCSPLLLERQRAACHDISFLPLMSLGWSAASFADCDDAVPAKLRMTPAITEPLFKKIVSCLCRGTLPPLILSLRRRERKGEGRERCPLSDDRKEREIYQESDAKIKTS